MQNPAKVTEVTEVTRVHNGSLMFTNVVRKCSQTYANVDKWAQWT